MPFTPDPPYCHISSPLPSSPITEQTVIACVNMAAARFDHTKNTGVDWVTEKMQTLVSNRQSMESDASAFSTPFIFDSSASSACSSPKSSPSPDLQIMDPPTEMFDVRTTPNKGLAAFATSDIARGTTILLEKPLFRVVGDYLPTDIEQEYEKLPFESQRAFMTLASAHDFLFLEDRIRTVKRAMGTDPWPEDMRRLSMLEARALGRRSILSTFYANSISTKDGSAIFLKASRLNHSCVPNASYHWAPHRGMVQIRTTRNIKEGEELTLSYLDPCQMVSARQSWLKDNYAFECDCLACGEVQDPSSFAFKSLDRRLKLDEYRKKGYQFESSVEMDKLKNVVGAFQEEGLCIPQLGTACMRMGELYGKIKGLERQEVDMLELAVDTFVTCYGEEFQESKEALKALEGAKAKMGRE